jgi:hypothetical protein
MTTSWPIHPRMFTSTSSHFYLLTFLSIGLLWAVQLILRPNAGHNKQTECSQMKFYNQVYKATSVRVDWFFLPSYNIIIGNVIPHRIRTAVPRQKPGLPQIDVQFFMPLTPELGTRLTSIFSYFSRDTVKIILSRLLVTSYPNSSFSSSLQITYPWSWQSISGNMCQEIQNMHTSSIAVWYPKLYEVPVLTPSSNINSPRFSNCTS